MKCSICGEGLYCLYDEEDREVYYCLAHYKEKCNQLAISYELNEENNTKGE